MSSRPLRAALALLALAGATAARAEELGMGGGASPMSGSFEFRYGNYKPNVDGSSFSSLPAGATGPWASTFGSGRKSEFSLHGAKALPWRTYGTVEIGLGAAWFQANGQGHFLGGGASQDTTSFSMVPTSLTLTYRADVLFDRFGFPLVPYGRVALQRYNWWVTGTTGSTSKSGATDGYSYGGGVAFVLDWVDAGLARELDHDTGINHTMLVFDASKTKVDDFGATRNKKPTSWDLSDTTWTYSFGLLFVF